MSRQEFAGAAPQTTLAAGINAAALSISVASGTGYPTGAVGPFVIVIDRGLSTEEKILCDSRSGNTFTVNASGRGYDGTTAQAHSSGAILEHALSAAKINELDAYVNSAFTGDVTAASGAKVTTIANNAVTTAKIADDAVTYDKLVGASATARFLTRFTAGAGNWEETTVAQALALLSLDSTDLSDFIEAVQDVLGAFTGLGGSGLAFSYDDAGNAVTLAVNVDGVTLEINADTIRIKDLGVTAAKLAADAVTTAKILDANVTQAKMASGLRVPVTCTSGTKPGAPLEGDIIYLTDLDRFEFWTGAAWARMITSTTSAFTPTLTADSASPTLGTGGSATGVYSLSNDGWYNVESTIIFGTGATAGVGNYRVATPAAVTAPLRAAGQVVGTGWVYDSSAVAVQHVIVEYDATTYVKLRPSGAYASFVGAGTPWTWAAGDEINISYRIRA